MKKNNVVYTVALLLSLVATQAQAALYISSGAPRVVNAPVPAVANIAKLPLVQIHLSSVKKEGGIGDIGDFSLEELSNANLDKNSEGSDTITVSTTSVATTPSIPTHSASLAPTTQVHSASFGGVGASTQSTLSVINDSGVILVAVPFGPVNGGGGLQSAFTPPPASVRSLSGGAGGAF